RELLKIRATRSAVKGRGHHSHRSSAGTMMCIVTNAEHALNWEDKLDAMETQGAAHLRDYLAAERTVLAWIRTALSLMGFGVVGARLGLFLQELQASQRVSPLHYVMSVWFGTALIGAGVLVNLLSGLHHAGLIRSLNQGRDMRPHSTTLALATSLFLALVGI